MASVDVMNKSGEKVSETELPDDIFCVPVKNSVLHDMVRMQLVSRRRGTAKAMGRSEVSGSTRKLFRQKGTGNARAGSIKSPLRKGGGVIFGPSQKSWAFSLPKKVKALALKMALSSKLSSDEIFVLDSFALDSVKTKTFDQIVNTLGLKNILVVIDGDDRNLLLSSRNIPDVKVVKVEGLNVYDILKYDTLVLLESSIKGIEGRFQTK
ncbi:MAG: 50S ribosomal protein L4 [Pseudomonadota bacterium]